MSQSNRAWPEPSSASVSRSSLRRAAAIRSCSAAAMRLRVCASRPISLPVRTSVRCSKRPSPSRRASALSWRSGRAIRRATQAARTRPIASMPRPSSRLSRALALAGPSAASIGMPTYTSHGTERARAKPAIRATPSRPVFSAAAPAFGEAAQQQGALHRRGLADPALGLERAADHSPLGVDQRDHAAGREGRLRIEQAGQRLQPGRDRDDGDGPAVADDRQGEHRRPLAAFLQAQRRLDGDAGVAHRGEEERSIGGTQSARRRHVLGRADVGCRRAPTARRRSGWPERSAPGDAGSRRCARGRPARSARWRRANAAAG